MYFGHESQSANKRVHLQLQLFCLQVLMNVFNILADILDF